MTHIDLSNYSGLFILGIIILSATFIYMAYKFDGKAGVGISLLATILGCFLSIGIVKSLNFEDATPETVVTVCVGTIGLNLIYISIRLFQFMKIKYKDQLKKEINILYHEISDLEKQIEQKKSVLNLIQLLEMCGGTMENIEQLDQLIDVRIIQNKINSNNKIIQYLSNKL